MNEGTKVCPGCKLEKPLSAQFYYPRHDCPGSFSSQCKVCKIKAASAYVLRYPDHRKELANKHGRKYTELLTDFYIKTLLVNEGIEKENITPGMILLKRDRVLARRELRRNFTPQEIKSMNMKAHIDRISTFYIKRLLNSKGLLSKDITPQIIELKRQLILLRRGLKNLRRNYESNSAENSGTQ